MLLLHSNDFAVSIEYRECTQTIWYKRQMIKCRCDLQLDTKLRVTPLWSLNLVGGEVSPASWPWAPLR